MKRRLFNLALFILLGALVNIAVAWSIAWWGDPPTSFTPRDPVTEDDRQWWMEHRPLEAVGEPTVRVAASLIGVAEVQMRNIELDGTRHVNSVESPSFQSFRRRFGLPLLTLEYSYWTQEVRRPFPFNKQPFQVDSSIWTHTFLVPSRSIVHYHAQGVLAFENKRPDYISSARGLPYLVQPLGLIVNTLVYALACYLAISVIGLIIRWLRSNRRMARQYVGLCPKCGYNILGDFEQGCPECGWGREVEA